MSCLVAAVLCGCAGGGARTVTVVRESSSGSGSVQQAPDTPREPVAPGDRRAYREILATSTLLDKRADGILAGTRAGATELQQARARIARLHPRSRVLVSLRGALAEAIDNLLGDQTRVAARAAKKSILAITLDLVQFNSTHAADTTPAS